MDNELLAAKIAAIGPKALWFEGGRDDEPNGLVFPHVVLIPKAPVADSWIERSRYRGAHIEIL